MIQLRLHNKSFQYLHRQFEQWLYILGYSPSTVRHLPQSLIEFLYYLETIGLDNIQDIQQHHFTDYYQRLSQRTNQRRGGGLSNAYLNKHRQALVRFAEYLRKNAKLSITAPDITCETTETTHPDSLTHQDIQSLFSAADNFHELLEKSKHSETVFQALASRDKAILTIFYSCGLRRSEGVGLNVADIDLHNRLIHVRQGKGHKDRLVPFTRQSRIILREYLFDHRPEILKGTTIPAFLVGQRQTRLQGRSIAIRLRVLQQRCLNSSIHTKNIHLHLLRHSIATHLLQNGMSLDGISRFLGHKSLNSTQVYTHILEENT